MAATVVGVGSLQILPTLHPRWQLQVRQQLGSVGNLGAQSGQQIGHNVGSGIGQGVDRRTVTGVGRNVAKFLIAGVAAAGIGKAISKVVTTGLDEVKDYQKGFAQLQQGLKSTGNVAGLSANQMEDLASSIEKYSGQTDDSIVATEQLLLTFTNIRNVAGQGNDVFTQTTKIAADMAARLGGDASGAAVQLGKALNDPVKGVTALQRVGVSFDAQQKKQIKTFVDSGNVMGAQKIILAELTKEFGGSAKAVGDTLPGQIERGKRAFEGFAQGVVGAVIPRLVSLGSWLGPKLATAASVGTTAAGRGLGVIKNAVTSTAGPIATQLQPALVNFGRNALDVGARIGKGLLPALRDVGTFVTRDIVPSLQNLARFGAQVATDLRPAAQTLGAIFGSTLVGAARVLGVLLVNVVGPAVRALTGFLSDNRAVISSLAIAVGSIIAVWASYRAALAVTFAVQTAFAVALRTSQGAVATLRANIIGLYTTMAANPVVAAFSLAIGAATFAFISFEQGAKRARDSIKSVTDEIQVNSLSSLDAARVKLEQQTAQLHSNKAAWDIVHGGLIPNISAIGELKTKQDELGPALQRVQAQQATLGTSLDGLTTRWQTSDDAVTALANSLKIDLSQAGAATNPQLLALGDAAFRATPALNATKVGVQGVGGSADLARSQMTLLNDQFDRLIGVNITAVESNARLSEGLINLRTQIQQNGLSLDTNSLAGARNIQAITGQLNTSRQLAQAIFDQTYQQNIGKGSTIAAQIATDAYSTSLRASQSRLHDQLIALGLNKGQVDALMRSMNLVGPTTRTQASAAATHISDMARNIAGSLLGIPRHTPINVDAKASFNVADLQKAKSIFLFGDGGLVKPFANGGVENHRAQIAPGGSMRVWAEPETGGEAYIPLAPSKRQRSVAIWHQTGKLLGQDVSYFAGGGFEGVQAHTSIQNQIPGQLHTLYQNFVAGARNSATKITQQFMHNLLEQFDAGDLSGPAYHGRGTSWVGGDVDGLNSAFFSRLNKMAIATRQHISVTSGFRSVAEQALLYARYLTGNGNLAAAPGKSNHNTGLAADINPGRGTFGGVAGRFGLMFPIPSEAWHIEPVRGPGLYAGASFSGGLKSGSIQAQVDAAAAARGWGGQLGALHEIISHESSWSPTAKNPGSTAYGLFQLLYGAGNSVPAQITNGFGYISQRYGNPANAWSFWQRHGWYDTGGILPPDGLINDTGRNERVLTPRQNDAFEQLVAQLSRDSTAGGLQKLADVIQVLDRPDIDHLAKKVQAAQEKATRGFGSR